MSTINRWKKLWKQQQNILGKTSVRQWILGSLVFLGLYGILMINLLPTGFDLEVGQVSRADIVAPRTVINRVKTQQRQDEASDYAVRAANQDPANYDVNHATVLRTQERLEGVFGWLGQGVVMEEDDLPISNEEIQIGIKEDWHVELSLESIREILSLPVSQFQDFTADIDRLVMDQMQERIPSQQVGEVRNTFRDDLADSALRLPLQRAAAEIGHQIIQPNLVLNTAKVEQARLEAMQAVEPVAILQGEVIVRKGDVVRPEHIRNLQDLGLHRTGIDFFSLIGLLLILGLLLSIFGLFLFKYKRDILNQEGRLALLGSIIIVVAFSSKILAMIQWSEAAFLAPVALAGVLITLLLDSRTGVMSIIVLSVVISLIFDSLVVILLALIGGLIAVFSVSQVSQRGDLMRAGFVVGAGNFMVMVSLGLLQGDFSLILHSYLGLLNGIFSSVIAIGSLPYLESVFGITSAIRLLELSNPNQPLLRRLLMETPGTYHHSILVGNLAEAAAEAVGADGLLARVGSTYHDIGKLKRPYFFVENQVGMENPHDKISPTLSTLIITSHVKDGLELAREYKLPRVVTMFISEHHGSDLVKYFYHRAKENGSATIQEKDFRYPGPKPQSKETAIVSVADAVEAAVRSLVKPTPRKIETLVHKIIRDRMEDGQLDESELTFKDLDKIADAFVKVLIGIFHARVEYPENITREDIEGKGK